MRVFERIGVPYHVIVEEQEYTKYAAVIDRSRILVLDKQFQRDYDPCDDHGDTKSKGSGPARNFAWAQAVAAGAAWHWVIDDNIREFYRLHENAKIPVGDGTIFRCMEDFAQRYTNVAMAGPHYESFVPRRYRNGPFVLNTRIFSCNLIRTDLPFRWRGRYNEDADLSLRMLKAGLCTVLFNAFLQKKIATQLVPGGNTTELYAHGTAAKSRMLVALHPDVARLAWRYGRHHHYVDYSQFKTNQLVRRDDLVVSSGVDNFGMKVVPHHPSKAARRQPKAAARGGLVELSFRHMQGGNVPGGHNVISDGVRKPFITTMRECNSISLRHSDVVADIGAYVGTYAIRCARFPVQRVVAYEPTPFSHQVLSLTKLPNLELRRAAVVPAAHVGEVNFFVSHGIGVTNSTQPSSAKTGTRVAAMSYEQAVAGATIVKIDIEGGEYDLPIVQPNLRAVIIDFHKVAGRDWKAEAERIIGQLRDAGFRAVIEPNWLCGWTLAGSWQRERPDPGGGCDLMLRGSMCCGCAAVIERASSKAVCEVCWPSWLPRHRVGYLHARRALAAA